MTLVDDLIRVALEFERRALPELPCAFRAHPADVYALRLAVAPPDVCDEPPNPFYCVRVHHDVSLERGVIVPLTAAQELSWLRSLARQRRALPADPSSP